MTYIKLPLLKLSALLFNYIFIEHCFYARPLVFPASNSKIVRGYSCRLLESANQRTRKNYN